MEMVRFGSFHSDIAAMPDGTASFELRVSTIGEQFINRLKELANAPKVTADD
jgi:hypothetical protein